MGPNTSSKGLRALQVLPKINNPKLRRIYVRNLPENNTTWFKNRMANRSSLVGHYRMCLKRILLEERSDLRSFYQWVNGGDHSFTSLDTLDGFYTHLLSLKNPLGYLNKLVGRFVYKTIPKHFIEMEVLPMTGLEIAIQRISQSDYDGLVKVAVLFYELYSGKTPLPKGIGMEEIVDRATDWKNRNGRLAKILLHRAFSNARIDFNSRATYRRVF